MSAVYRLPGIWFYERIITDCLCIITVAGRTPMHCGECLYCEQHKRMATVTMIAPASLEAQEELLRVDTNCMVRP